LIQRLLVLKANFTPDSSLSSRTCRTHSGAIDLHRLYGYAYWDSLVIRCALVSGCKVILSEDMQHGQVIDGLRIVNPFL
jgi:predicted nucleic acid-binding protein